MRIHIGSDHAGLEFKGVIVKHLQGSGHEVIDHGPLEYDALDDIQFSVFLQRKVLQKILVHLE